MLLKLLMDAGTVSTRLQRTSCEIAVSAALNCAPQVDLPNGKTVHAVEHVYRRKVDCVRARVNGRVSVVRISSQLDKQAQKGRRGKAFLVQGMMQLQENVGGQWRVARRDVCGCACARQL